MANNFLKSCFAFILIGASINAAFSQNLRGKISDNNSEKLAGATVRLKSSAYGTVSDIDGNYVLKLGKGEHVVVFSFIGFKTLEKAIRIENDDVILDVVLENAVHLSKEFVVSGLRADASKPMAYTDLDKAQIEKLNLGQDLPYLIEWTPSMVVTSDAGAGVGYTGVRIRGSDANRINVTVNGIPINDPESHGVFWVNMPDLGSSANSIQIQRGVGTSTNGAGAFGGSINIQTNELNDEAYAEISNSFGSFNTMKNTLRFGSGIINKHFSFDGRVSNIQSDGYIDRARSSLRSHYLSANYTSKKTSLKLVHFGGNEETYQAWYGTPRVRLNNDIEGMENFAALNGLSDSQKNNLLNAGRTYNFYEYDNEVDNYTQNHWQLHFNQQINNKLQAAISLHYTKGYGYFEQYRENDRLSTYNIPPVILSADTITRSDVIRRRWLDNDFFGMVYQINYVVSSNSTLSLGGGANRYIGDHFGEIIWARFAGNSEIRERYYDNTSIKNDVNSFLKYELNVNNKWLLFTDLQYRYIDYQAQGVDHRAPIVDFDENYHFFNPKAGISYLPTANLKCFFSVSVANREPVRADFLDAPNNVNPLPEQLIDYEAGIDYTWKKIKFGSNLFFMDYYNQLVLTGAVNDVGAAIRQNVDRSYRAGIELMAYGEIGKRIELNANATFSRNKIQNFTQYVDNWDTGIQSTFEHNAVDIAFSPNQILALDIAYNLIKLENQNLKFNFLSKYVGKQFLDNTQNNSKALDAYFTNDIRLEYILKNTFCKEMRLNLMVRNVFNEDFASNGYVYDFIFNGNMGVIDGLYPQAFRNYLAGISFLF